MNHFRFEKILSIEDDMMLPGALKYGGLMTLAGLCAPHELYLYNTEGTGSARFLDAAYQATGGHDKLKKSEQSLSPEALARWLLR